MKTRRLAYYLAPALFIALMTTSSLAQKTKSALTAEIQNQLASGTNINAFTLRGVLTDMTNSWIGILDPTMPVSSFFCNNGSATAAPTTCVYGTGAWTPTLLANGSVGGTALYSVQSGSYEQIGRQVTARFNLTTLTNGSAIGMTGTMTLSGLPVAAGGLSANDVGICTLNNVSGWNGTVGSSPTLSAIITPSTSVAVFTEWVSGTKGSTTTPVAEFGSGVVLAGICNYHI